MTIHEGIRQKGNPVEIPNCSRDDLPQFFVDMGYKAGAEIGVASGEFAKKFCQAGLNLLAIDPWLSYTDYTDSRGQQALESLYEDAKKLLSPFSTCTIIRKTSIEAAATIQDRSLDFVYIDGNHQLMYVIEDLVTWSKKVKLGGIIAGHDYIYTNPRTQAGICHVIYALNAYLKAYKINNFYLLGRKENVTGETRDRFRSWMFFNKDLKFRDE